MTCSFRESTGKVSAFFVTVQKKEIATCLKVANTFDKKISDNALDFYS